VRRGFTALLSKLDIAQTLDVDTWEQRLAEVPELSSEEFTWVTCAQGMRCVPSGLWYAFHLLTVNSKAHGSSPAAVMDTISTFVSNFFGCERCRAHFSRSFATCDFGRCAVEGSGAGGEERALIMWLWAFHNAVSIRVAREAALRHKVDFTWQDASRKLWPGPLACPACWSIQTLPIGAEDSAFSEPALSDFLARHANVDRVYQELEAVYRVSDSLAEGITARSRSGSVGAESRGGYGWVLASISFLVFAVVVYRQQARIRRGMHKKDRYILPR
jgi:hypothetical protein